MNNKERLSRLIAQYQKNMEFYRNAREFNEQDCRDEFISPLLESFGWDVHNEKGTSPQYKEVVVEKFSNRDRKSTRLNSSHRSQSRMPSSA